MPDPAFTSFILVTSFVVGLSGALQPGPLLMLSIAEVARKGFWAGPLLVAGHGIAEFAMVLLLAFGASTLLQAKGVAGASSLVGGAYLIWMSLGTMRGVRDVSLEFSSNDSERWSSVGPVLVGIWASITNPGWLVWWATVGASYTVLAVGGGIVDVLSFYTGHILADLAWYSLVAAVVASGRQALTDTLYRRVLMVCGLLLLIIGGYFVINGLVTIGIGLSF